MDTKETAQGVGCLVIIFGIIALVDVPVDTYRATWMSVTYFVGSVAATAILTLVVAILENLMINAIRRAINDHGSSGYEWRYKDTNAFYRIATASEVFEHFHGSGSWEGRELRNLIFGAMFRLFVVIATTLFVINTVTAQGADPAVMWGMAGLAVVATFIVAQLRTGFLALFIVSSGLAGATWLWMGFAGPGPIKPLH